MSSSSKPAADAQPQAASDPFFVEVYGRSGGQSFGLPLEEFARALQAAAKKYLPADAGPQAARELLAGLHLEELALAQACAAGSERAWEVFLVRYREKLYDAARAIAKEDATARELADSLYADLFGTRTQAGERVSKLKSYLGRGSLEGWLRSVLAQEFVNRYRSQKRLVSLEEQTEDGAQFPAAAPPPAIGHDPRVEAAVDEALAALGAEERFVLAAYYLDGRTLAEIARMLGVHESTISRRVEKITAGLRQQVKSALVRRGMSRAQAEEALEVDVRDLSLDIRGRLGQETVSKSFLQRTPGAQAAVRPERRDREA